MASSDTTNIITITTCVCFFLFLNFAVPPCLAETFVVYWNYPDGLASWTRDEIKMNTMDGLTFMYSETVLAVYEVDKDGYDSCSTSTQGGKWLGAGGAAFFRANLQSAGKAYFIPLNKTCCQEGMKITAGVSPSTSDLLPNVDLPINP